MLLLCDFIIYVGTVAGLLLLDKETDQLTSIGITQQVILSLICIFVMRIVFKSYDKAWKDRKVKCYIHLLCADFIALIMYLLLVLLLPVEKISFVRMLSFVCINSLGAITLRLLYQNANNCHCCKEQVKEAKKIKIAIVGAGRVGVSLAVDLMNNSKASYVPKLFIDINKEKVGKDIYGIPVLSEDKASLQRLRELEIQEIIFAIPSIGTNKKKTLYEYYKNAGYKLKVYDSLSTYDDVKCHLREFDIEELLFRKPHVISDERTNKYYKNKVVLITGGGGSIGSELCRQLAKMHPKKIIILDIYENGAYNLQQELKIIYGDSLDLQIEICSITNRNALRTVFERHHPQIIINAAAHKHVPLMEHNCIEAIYNNVFGTLNLVELC